MLREAREQLDVILAGLLAGKFDEDQDMAPVARKVTQVTDTGLAELKVALPNCELVRL